MSYTMEELSDCLAFHEQCNALCCRYFKVKMCRESKKAVKKAFKNHTTIKLFFDVNPLDYEYWMLHGVLKVDQYGILLNPDDYNVEYVNGACLFHRDCNALKGCMCGLHGTLDKPRMCVADEGDNNSNPKCRLYYK